MSAGGAHSKNPRSWHSFGFLRRWFVSLSGIGLALGTLLFAASLTPSLIPRTYWTQGVLAGASFAFGYGIGEAWRWLWQYLELPPINPRVRRAANAFIAVVCLSIVMIFLWRAAEWQNSIRLRMEMEPVTTAHPFWLCLIAIATFAALLAVARLFRLVAFTLAERAKSYIPRRVANVLGLSIAFILFWSLTNDVFVRSTMLLLDASFRKHDAMLDPERPQPLNPMQTGSNASLVSWHELGRAGREFIASGPSASEISALTQQPAMEPVRVYVGLQASDFPKERASLALEELKRVGAFDRSVLIVATPTGTGWVDPAAIDAIEYLHHGDIATVAMQYSYLASPLSLLVQPEYGAQAANALFLTIYRYWTELPRETRPKLYLQGLSLGALHSERSADMLEMLGDPINGALWSGPPFASPNWQELTDSRNPESPAWLPEFRNSSVIRFMNQKGFSVPSGTPWGPMRVVYLQYASDPVVFFEYGSLYSRPEWMETRVGPDVSPELRWYPIVTMLQLALDMAVSTTTPIGYGHVYAPEHYIDAWLEVTAIDDWSNEDIDRLKQHLSVKSQDAHLAPKRSTGENVYDNRGG